MFKEYIQLCWLKGYPDDLPTDRKFLWVNLGCYFLLGLFIQTNISGPIEAFMQIIVEVLVTVMFMGALLYKDGSTYNFERFLTAILVCENFVYVVALPLAFWFIFAKGSDAAFYPVYVGVALMLWSIAIIAHLLMGLFGYSWRMSTALSVLYFILTYFGSYVLLLLMI